MRHETSDPYSRGLVTSAAFVQKAEIDASFVAIMDLEIAGRGLQLESYLSRAFRAGDVCELIVTGTDAEPGGTVPDATYLGFVTIGNAGLMVVGDVLLMDAEPRATLLGFDTTHLPNHYNVVFHMPEPATGARLGLTVGSHVTFAKPAP